MFGELFLGAWATATKAELAVSGFKKSGICPFSFEALPKESFLISRELLGQSDNELPNQSQEVTVTEAPCVPADIFPQDQMADESRRGFQTKEPCCSSNIIDDICDIEDETRIPTTSFSCAMMLNHAIDDSHG